MPCELFVERRQRGLGAEHQIGRILDLHQAPMVGLLEGVEHRTAQRRLAIKDAVEHPGREAVGQFLSAVPVVDADEGVVPGCKADTFSGQLIR